MQHGVRVLVRADSSGDQLVQIHDILLSPRIQVGHSHDCIELRILGLYYCNLHFFERKPILAIGYDAQHRAD